MPIMTQSDGAYKHHKAQSSNYHIWYHLFIWYIQIGNTSFQYKWNMSDY